MGDYYETQGEFTSRMLAEFWSSNYEDDEEYGELIDFLNKAENFRTFDTGLTEFIKKHGYIEKEGLSEEVCFKQRVNFLKQKFDEKNIPFGKGTIKNYFEGKIRPDSKWQSRQNIFKVCFALDLDVDETTAFFNKIYFDRTFNVKNIDELVYYFCIKNKKSYNDAERLIEDIKKMLDEDLTPVLDETVYTSAIREKTDFFTEESELIRYVLENKHAFKRYNTTATRYLDRLLDRIQGKKEDKIIVEKIKDSEALTSQDQEDIKKCGLVVQEVLKNYGHEFLNVNKHKERKKDLITRNQTIYSIDFMLFVIYFSNKPVRKSDFSFAKNANLLDIIRNNFPSDSSFSKLRNKPNHSFDALRKMIILLEFYTFCFDADEAEDDGFDFFDDFTEQMNDVLDSCGMGPLYIGNPYDWLFLFCAKSEHPLDTFRSIIHKVSETDE